MSLPRLRSLVEVARKGAISAAAKSLALTQPALTRQIQLLEAEFGTPLLHRSRKGVALTDMGRLVEEEARALLDRYDRLRQSVGEHLRLEKGTVRIGAGATAVVAVLPEAIRAFRAEHPEVKIHVKEAGSGAVEADVVREEVELGIITLPAASREVEATPLREDPIVLVAAANHPLARRRRVPAAALAGLPLIAFEGGSAVRRLIDRALERRGVAMPVVMELRSIQSMLRMVAIHVGVAFVSRLGVDAEPARVRVVEVEGLRIRRTLGVITKRGRPLGVAARGFLRRLTQDSGSRAGAGAGGRP